MSEHCRFVLFAIMMLESKLNNLSKNTMKYIPIGLVFGTLFLVPLLLWNISEFRHNPYRTVLLSYLHKLV
jgi:NADH:ubiquinone oxidoreductase subunit 6 (subunit J)